MKSDKKIIRDILIFFLGVAAGTISIAVVILFYQKSFELFSAIVPAITTLLAAFLGAWSAYLLADNKEKRKEIALRRQAINRAIFVLVRQYNAIKLIQQELDKYRDNPGKAIELPAFSINRYEDLVQNFSSLEFMLDSENPTLLLELSLEQERFEQAIAAHRLRNKFYIEDLQPTLEGAGLTNKRTNLEEVAEKITERIYKGIVQATESLYEHIDESMKSIKSMHDKIRSFAKSMFPGEKIIGIDEET